ncbi:hypothetical protein QLQ12_44850 [Actinoplanes sp. NEAU-A12]|uniref:Uncharacterized protein n=1 Tax=Actinoplanes sandaracinus TaxID=3045177 RepID=A0ABT6X143_9ACTN|nr:hypothetical protein [Actinoplanes sandaracinus]MDI6105730.1 hypothetical protein [Actinoplanes sandaracinus]
MIARMLDATARHRRPILLGGVVVAVIEATLTTLNPFSDVRLTWLIVVPVLLLVLAGKSFRQARPTAFVVRPDLTAFVAPAAAGPVCTALCFLLIAADRVGQVAASVRTDGVSSFDIGTVALQVIVSSLLYVQAWVGFDISLRPDGLYDRRAVGTVFVPWQATPAAHVARRADGTKTVVIPPGVIPVQDANAASGRPTEVRMLYGRPELVRTGGLTRNANRITPHHVDASFLAAAIAFYASHPDDRAGIGTVHGLRHLQQALTPTEE